MGWVSLGSADLIEGTTTRGYVYFEYDDASGEPRSCRLRIVPRSGGYTFTVNFNNIIVDGVNYGSQGNLTQDSGTFWTGNLTGGRSVTAMWTNPWYAGTKSPVITGNLPAGSSAPTGGAVSVGAITWDSVAATSSVSDWGSGYTSGSNKITFSVVDPTATLSDWATKGRQSLHVPVASSTLTDTEILTTANTTANDGGWPIKGCTDFKVVGGGETSAGNSRQISAAYATPPSPSSLTSTDDGGTTDITFTIDFTGVAANNSTAYDQNSLVRTVRYKRGDDATWTYIDQDTPGLIGATTTFNLILSPKESADIEGWQTYKTQQSEVSSLHIENNNRVAHFYGGVRELDPQTGTWSNPEAKEVIKLYGSVSGERKKIIKMYGSVNGVAKQVYEDV